MSQERSAPGPGAGDPAQRADELGRRAGELLDRYQQSPDVDLLKAAIEAGVAAVGLAEPGSVAGLRHLDQLSMLRATLAQHTGDERELDSAIAGHETAVAQSAAPGIPVELRAALRHNAGMDRMLRFQRTGELADFDRALAHWRVAAHLPGVPAQRAAVLLRTYLYGLRELLERNESVEVLSEVVAAQHRLAGLGPEALPWLDLSNDLVLLHVLTADPAPLDEAVEAIRAGVEAARSTDPMNTPALLNHQAAVLMTRHHLAGAGEDRDAAIEALRQAAALLPPGSPDRAQVAANVARLQSQPID